MSPVLNVYSKSVIKTNKPTGLWSGSAASLNWCSFCTFSHHSLHLYSYVVGHWEFLIEGSTQLDNAQCCDWMIFIHQLLRVLFMQIWRWLGHILCNSYNSQSQFTVSLYCDWKHAPLTLCSLALQSVVGGYRRQQWIEWCVTWRATGIVISVNKFVFIMILWTMIDK